MGAGAARGRRRGRGRPVATLRELRLAKFWTQRELAERAQVTESTVATIERGVHRPRLSTARALAAALGAEPGAIDWPAGPAADEEPG